MPPSASLRELLDDVRHARVVEQNLAGLPRRGVHRDVQRRQPVLENPRDVALLDVRQRREVAVGEGQTIVVVAHVERLAQALGQPFDEAELAAIGAAANGRRLELHAHRFAFGALDLVDDRLRRPGRRASMTSSSSAVRNSQSRKSASSRPLTVSNSVPGTMPSSSAMLPS